MSVCADRQRTRLPFGVLVKELESHHEDARRLLDKESHHPFRSREAKNEYLAFIEVLAQRWPVPFEERFVDTSFGQTFMRVQGPANGVPMVLLPGDTETSLSWLPVIKPHSQNFRTYALDHVYDNGRSIYAKELSRPEDFVDWLDEVFDELGLERLNLAAYSYGAWQSALYALAHPDRVEKLVLLAPSSTVLSPGPNMLTRAILYHFLPFRWVARNYFYWYGPDTVKEDGVRARVDEMVEEDLLARRCFKKRRFVPPTRLTDAQWQALQVPTLFLVGENDKTYSAKLAIDRLRRVAPAVDGRIASKTDHFVTLTNPGWVVQNVLEFL